MSSRTEKTIWLTDFCDSVRIFVSVIMIQIIVIIYALSFLTYDMNFLRKLSILTLLAQLVGLSLLIIMCKLRSFFNRLEVIPGITVLTVLVVFLTTVLSQIMGYLDIQLSFHLFSKHVSTNQINLKLSISSVLVCLALVRYFYIQDQWKSQVQKLSEARLTALQARIKPHFLFNSLNSIAALIAIDQQKAEEVILDFSGLMRRAFTHKDNKISIQEELEWVKSYLAIEQLRLADRLTYCINCEAALKQINIPILCIQPMVENAVIHGIQPLEHGGKISIDIFTQQEKLCINISNPFIASINANSNGMALRNIRQRLLLQYGNKASLITKDDDNTYTAQLELPL